jgi:hypothetical protein
MTADLRTILRQCVSAAGSNPDIAELRGRAFAGTATRGAHERPRDGSAAAAAPGERRRRDQADGRSRREARCKSHKRLSEAVRGRIENAAPRE